MWVNDEEERAAEDILIRNREDYYSSKEEEWRRVQETITGNSSKHADDATVPFYKATRSSEIFDKKFSTLIKQAEDFDKAIFSGADPKYFDIDKYFYDLHEKNPKLLSERIESYIARNGDNTNWLANEIIFDTKHGHLYTGKGNGKAYIESLYAKKFPISKNINELVDGRKLSLAKGSRRSIIALQSAEDALKRASTVAKVSGETADFYRLMLAQIVSSNFDGLKVSSENISKAREGLETAIREMNRASTRRARAKMVKEVDSMKKVLNESENLHKTMVAEYIDILDISAKKYLEDATFKELVKKGGGTYAKRVEGRAAKLAKEGGAAKVAKKGKYKAPGIAGVIIVAALITASEIISARESSQSQADQNTNYKKAQKLRESAKEVASTSPAFLAVMSTNIGTFEKGVIADAVENATNQDEVAESLEVFASSVNSFNDQKLQYIAMKATDMSKNSSKEVIQEAVNESINQKISNKAG